jgi:hypothetical protein
MSINTTVASGYEQLRTETDFVVQMGPKPDLSIRHTLIGNPNQAVVLSGLFTGLSRALHSQSTRILCSTMVLLSDAASTAKEWSSRVSLYH